MPRPTPSAPIHHARAAVLAGLLALAGCGAPPKVAPPVAPTVQGGGAAPPSHADADAPTGAAKGYVWSSQMDDLARRLQGALAAPVSVAQTTDQRLWVSMPASEAFATGRSALKPQASGWLDQVAIALRTNRRAAVQIIAGADAGARGPAAESQALDRAASARDWIVARGIPAPRIAVSGLAARATATAGADARRLDLLIGERADAR